MRIYNDLPGGEDDDIDAEDDEFEYMECIDRLGLLLG